MSSYPLSYPPAPNTFHPRRASTGQAPLSYQRPPAARSPRRYSSYDDHPPPPRSAPAYRDGGYNYPPSYRNNHDTYYHDPSPERDREHPRNTELWERSPTNWQPNKSWEQQQQRRSLTMSPTSPVSRGRIRSGSASQSRPMFEPSDAWKQTQRERTPSISPLSGGRFAHLILSLRPKLAPRWSWRTTLPPQPFGRTTPAQGLLSQRQIPGAGPNTSSPTEVKVKVTVTVSALSVAFSTLLSFSVSFSLCISLSFALWFSLSVTCSILLTLIVAAVLFAIAVTLETSKSRSRSSIASSRVSENASSRAASPVPAPKVEPPPDPVVDLPVPSATRASPADGEPLSIPGIGNSSGNKPTADQVQDDPIRVDPDPDPEIVIIDDPEPAQAVVEESDDASKQSTDVPAVESTPSKSPTPAPVPPKVITAVEKPAPSATRRLPLPLPKPVPPVVARPVRRTPLTRPLAPRRFTDNYKLEDIPPLSDAKSLADALRSVIMKRMLCDPTTREQRVDPILAQNLSLSANPDDEYLPLRGQDRLVDGVSMQRFSGSTDDPFVTAKSWLVGRFRKREVALGAKIRGLQEEYQMLHAAWRRQCDALDQQSKPAELPDAANAAAPAARTTRRSAALGDTVRSDLEMEQIIASLGYDEATDPHQLSLRNLATIPDMVPLAGQTPYAYDDTNYRVENPHEYYAPNTGIHDWTPEEKDTYLDAFARHPKAFGLIADALPNKTAQQCVEYYYLHKKKIIDFRRVVAQLAPKRGRRRVGRPPGGKGSGLLSDIRQHDAEMGHHIVDHDDEPGSYAGRGGRGGRRAIVPEGRKPSGRRGYSETATPTPEPELEASGSTRPRRRRVSALNRNVYLQDEDDEDTEEEPKQKKKRGRKPKSAAVVEDDSAAPTPPPEVNFTQPGMQWSTEDKALFLTLVKQHGPNFKRIAILMPDKTSAQVSDYYNSLDVGTMLADALKKGVDEGRLATAPGDPAATPIPQAYPVAMWPPGVPYASAPYAIPYPYYISPYPPPAGTPYATYTPPPPHPMAAVPAQAPPVAVPPPTSTPVPQAQPAA
ncbi:Nuclear receptor corepressor 2-like [Mycena chlorophos]|uniref:Nuclear receptor corepressor 2-like n=1 Tax=Mycena chlorophos TaxID=658473 RepID=A0A8H6TLL2_MYCCL|nr:Nuclear receptor corepressor 2-like [Mycena chlorophos]